MGSIDEAGGMRKGHLVLVPYPAQGHVTPFLKLGKLLHSYGFHITFVNTEFNHNRLLSSRGPSALDGLPGFRFETIPDGLPPSDESKTQDVPALCDSTTKNCLAPFRELLLSLNDSSASSNVPPVTCVVTDGVMSFAIDAAKEFGIPDVLFWTPSACGFMAYLHYHELIARGLVPFKDESDMTDEFLSTTIDWIPALKNMRLKDIPSFIRTTNKDDIMLNFFVRETRRASMASAIILNTFDDLERPVLDAMAKMLPPIYTIGPICLLSRHIPPNSPLASMGSSLWKEDTSCLEWLEGKDPGSVVLVSFGSITTMTNDQLIEFAWGLANSNISFLWVVRPDLVEGESGLIPEEFFTETEKRGLLASWCNQETVLMHPSIGGFLTHCGWNSTLESISSGVPTLCWPFFAEQQTNCRYLCTEWGMGMEIDNNVKRKEVEEIIRELMGGEKGKEMRRRASEWKERAFSATMKPGGNSFLNFDRVVKEVLLPKKSK
ncbi:7-deoxyloganetin glucosyltransferase-like [Iris pallida]|uniref:Glycosyltransferase n=1 Tax=Iris pallida TaxID=29817 RepID=A0AAX6HRZ7_IRIPA|nr:7-deoxyloganetin glucosyltransferase-like [Iris pallida]